MEVVDPPWSHRTTEPLVVLDTTRDWRFAKNPLVLGDPHGQRFCSSLRVDLGSFQLTPRTRIPYLVRFYAGTPLQTPEGYNIGSLCLIDDKPRTEFSPRQRHVLKEFGQIVMREMELWRDKLHLRRRGMIQDSVSFRLHCMPATVSIADRSLNLLDCFDECRWRSSLGKQSRWMDRSTLL
jgi:hypothetical protein